jgi:hypothetical protein
MRMPLSSQAADLIRIVSWSEQLSLRALSAILMADQEREDLKLATERRASPEREEDGRTVLSEQGDHAVISAPDNVLDRKRRQLSENLLLLEIEERDGRRAGEDDACGSTVEDVVGLDGGLARLGDVEGEVSNVDGLEREEAG